MIKNKLAESNVTKQSLYEKGISLIHTNPKAAKNIFQNLLKVAENGLPLIELHYYMAVLSTEEHEMYRHAKLALEAYTSYPNPKPAAVIEMAQKPFLFWADTLLLNGCFKELFNLFNQFPDLIKNLSPISSDIVKFYLVFGSALLLTSRNSVHESQGKRYLNLASKVGQHLGPDEYKNQKVLVLYGLPAEQKVRLAEVIGAISPDSKSMPVRPKWL